MNRRQILTIICTASIFLFSAGCNTPVGPDVEMLTPISDQSTPPKTPSDSPGENTLIIYDDDGSRDGMAALLYLLSIPEISIEAVNISYGEAHPEQYIQLIGYALESVGVLDIPLGAGQDAPLANGNPFPDWLRQLGENFWDYQLPKTNKVYPYQNAPELMVSIINNESEPVTIFLSGTFTNLAQALRIDPAIKENITAVYFMGGAVHVPGNITNLIPDSSNKVAEWNIIADPQAAREVFAAGLNMYMIPLDATNQVIHTKEETLSWHEGDEKAIFAADLYDIMFDDYGLPTVEIFDQTAAVIMVQPDLCSFEFLSLDVIMDDGDTLGQTIVVPNGEPNIHVCLEPDVARVKKHLDDIYSGNLEPQETPSISTPLSKGKTIIVTSTSDSGSGSLRQALEDAQHNDTIIFDPAVFPPDAPVTITIQSDLPHIRVNNLKLDASNAGVILDGSQVLGDWNAGLQIVSGDENKIMGLQISHFPGPAISISGYSKLNVIGGDRGVGNGPWGQGNLISQNVVGIDLATEGTTLNTITGNLIGIDLEGTETLGNEREGVLIWEGAHANTIGPDNIIAFNVGCGIGAPDPDSTSNTVTQNNIYNNGNLEVCLSGVENSEITEVCPDCQTETSSDGQASIIFHNGVILTIEKSQPQAQAIAIQDNQILAVGSNSDIMTLKGPQTQIIDLGGLSMMPGFVEGHTHYIQNSRQAGTPLEEMMSNLVRFGLTSETEMHGDREFIEAMLTAEQNNEVIARVNIFAQHNYSYLVDDKTVIDPDWYLDNDPILDPSSKVRIPGVKIFMDGAGTPSRGCGYKSFPLPSTVTDVWPEVWEACRTPYGDLYLDEAQLTSALQTIQERGYRASLHVMGDASAAITLDAIEIVLDGRSNSIYRHQIQHNSLLSPELVQRYVQLDIIASVPGGFNTCDADEFIPIYGEEHYEWTANRFSLAGLGAHVYAVGDWTGGDVIKLNPFRWLYGLVNLQMASTSEVCDSPEWIAKHKIGVERALEMLTIEPAYAVSMEDYIGSIFPGKFADLIIISDNPITVDPVQIKDLQVRMTMIDGKVEFCAEGYEELCP